MITLWFDRFPPSDNHKGFFTSRRGGRRFVLSPATRLFYRYVYDLTRGVRPIAGWVTVSLAVVWPDRRRRDAQNLIKVLADSLQKAGIIGDDCRALIRIISIKRVGDSQGVASKYVSPGIHVTIEPASRMWIPDGEPTEWTPRDAIPEGMR